MDELYQHFRKEEHAFIDQAMGWNKQVEEQYIVKLTDFLDPREQFILTSVTGQSEENRIVFWGGQEYAERKRALILPPYITESNNFGVEVYELHYPSKFISIEHRHVLGTLMSLGLIRSKFGDILVKDNRIQIVLASEIADFVVTELTSVGKATVRLEKVEHEHVLEIEDRWQESSGTVSSLRLDAVLAEVYHVSRQKIQPIIQSGVVKVNWKIVENPSYECKINDILSTRGFGRCKIMSVEGKTKKEKWRILYGLQK